MSIGGLSRDVLDFLLPSLCALCGGLGGPICDGCAARLPWLGPPVCDRCGTAAAIGGGGRAEWNEAQWDGPLCPLCAQAPPPFARARALLSYTGEAQRVVQALKYDGVRHLATPLVRRAQVRWPRLFEDVDCVTFVPSTAARRRERGYNQAEVLARAAARSMGTSCAAWLVQEKPTLDQVELDAEARRVNVAEAYRLRGGAGAIAPAPPRRRRILLVDDVYTTGATIHACAALLVRAGWPEVFVWTLARVPRLHSDRRDRIAARTGRLAGPTDGRRPS